MYTMRDLPQLMLSSELVVEARIYPLYSVWFFLRRAINIMKEQKAAAVIKRDK